LGDMTDPDFLRELWMEFEAVLILSNDDEANIKTLMSIKRIDPEVHVITRASDPINKELMEKEGAGFVLLPSDVIAHVTLRYLERIKSSIYVKKLLKVVEGAKGSKLAIVLHDNPDPDAIASGLALKYIAESVGVDSEILYHGMIGHHVNRAFVNLLEVEMKKIENCNIDEFRKIALIETVPGANNSLPDGVEVNIIIDHHPLPAEEISAEYIDIRPNLGSTSTLMTKYLQELNLPIEKRIATALLHGIRTDTLGFKRGVHPEDLTAAAFLYPLADHELLEQIETPPMSTNALDVLGEAIRNRIIRGSILFTNVGFITDRDALPQAADYLLNLEGITTVVIFGLNETHIYISGRSKDVRLNIGDILYQAFGEIGSAGGHATAAAAQIPLGVFSGVKDKKTLMQLAEDAVMKRFFSVVGMELE
ncbi:MAG: DHH family phosphoesterase, partial [Candidatus Syntropharchaeia archaeon]